MRPVRKLRRSQTITPFGVGAVFDVLGESFVAEDISRWRGKAHVIGAERLSVRMGVSQIRTAPPAPPGYDQAELAAAPGMPFWRFPRWLFCPKCRRMTYWRVKDEKWGEAPRCSCAAHPQLIPMRFVMICGNGHLDDVDWHHWAHSRAETQDRKQCQSRDRLSFKVVKGVGGGLRSLRVVCGVCNASRDLDGIANPITPRTIGMRCRGRQPWQFTEESADCDVSPVIVQRGASNVHFPIIRSAIDIPPDSDYAPDGENAARIRNNANFQLLEQQPDHAMRDGLITMIAVQESVDAGEVLQLLDAVIAGDQESRYAVDDNPDRVILEEEWQALTAEPASAPHPRDSFVSRRVDLSPSGIDVVAADVLSGFDLLVQVTRLREVRALAGFSRYTQDAMVPPDLGKKLSWVPGIETFGEGLFLSLNETQVQDWERTPLAERNTAILARRFSDSFFAGWLDEPTPRFLLLHTLAHLLIRQLTYETGYSSASIRERVYAGANMAGILLYTAAGDSEGTLGGLVRQGEPARFASLIANSLRTATWCSLDPVCRESKGQGTDALNLAACHGCALVSETSCVASNVFLDRSLLIDQVDGFFVDLLARLPVSATSDGGTDG